MYMLNNELKDKINSIYEPEIIKINENNYIKISEYKYKTNTYFEVIFNKNGEEIFIGRYDKEYDKVKAQYKDAKILIYIDKFINEKKDIFITKVLGLYDILDQTFYCVTEEEALNMFDFNIDTTYLKTKDRMLKERNYRKIR